uniref:Ig-like domain-containing protein n=1 Tax=Neolamprologus brichardi TaxID=32507 RepID=A0A3Q4I1Z2_NEOBR
YTNTEFPQNSWMGLKITRKLSQCFNPLCELTRSSWHSNTNFSCVHLLQRMNGCEWDDETGEVNGFSQYDYDGENFLALDLQNRAWTVLKPQTVITKLRWDAEKDQLVYKNKVTYMNALALPTVSLLQKTPSSPISCHATGFYPDRAMMFWRKDGEEIHEGVAPGEILLNNDGTFQMSVDLELSSVTPEDWSSFMLQVCSYQIIVADENVMSFCGRFLPAQAFL